MSIAIRHIPGPQSQRYLLGFDLRRKPHLEADVLILGSGAAGCAAALAAADAGSEVLLLAKTGLIESNTRYAQGGIAAVLDEAHREEEDSVAQHLADTIAAGAGLVDPVVSEEILSGGEEAVELLFRYNCNFDGDTNPNLTREGGHRYRRILHAGDHTGLVMAQALTKAVRKHPNITIREDTYAIDLISDENGKILGALYQRRNEICAALAGATVLATGGCGRVFRETTNPRSATGDGLAMAYRAGATVCDMEFMQFHPTTLYLAGGPRLLITEAMRGEGAVLKNHEGERFMERYDPQGDLAPRDVVSQGILSEIQRDGFPHVWLDATHLGGDFLRDRFPMIYTTLARFGIDIGLDWIPVHPSAHYHCGGVLTDADGRTNLEGLFAAGEVGCTGLHGANRLASNSLLEALVVGQRAGILAAEEGGFLGRVRQESPLLNPIPEDLDSADLVRSLRAIMWRHVGPSRKAKGLETARRSLKFWAGHQARGAFLTEEGWELQNLLVCGQLITEAAAARPGSIGTHLRSDDDGSEPGQRIAMTRP